MSRPSTVLSGLLSNLTYRPILPYRLHFFYSMLTFRQQLRQKTQRYLRLFCTSLLSIIFAVLLCLSPLHWVRFRMLKDKADLFVGLWAVCQHQLCWNHIPKEPYYFQFSRAFFLISSLMTVISIICLSIYSIKEPGGKSLPDLGISILCFLSGACLFICLIFFLMHVKLHSGNLLKPLEPHFLLAYRLNYWCGVFYMIVGILSGINHLSSRISPTGENLLVVPITRARMRRMTQFELNLTKSSVGASPVIPHPSGMHLWPDLQVRSQSDVGNQIDSESRNESGGRNGLTMQAKLDPELEPTGQRAPETEGITENVASGGSSSHKHEGSEKK